jgi:hypothetical protein
VKEILMILDAGVGKLWGEKTKKPTFAGFWAICLIII